MISFEEYLKNFETKFVECQTLCINRQEELVHWQADKYDDLY